MRGKSSTVFQGCAVQINGETVVRPYTPVTLDNEYGHFDLVG